MENSADQKLAVLIDADNVPPGRIKAMLEEIAKYGTPTFKRIYGDWTSSTKSGWKSVLLPYAITPIQQYSYTSGKNSTDAALIIDAMDILYSGKVSGFCIVSSDSDFTRLATRLREAGMMVLGMGEKKTPLPFISACDKFIYIEILEAPAPEEKPEADGASMAKKKAVPVAVAKPMSKVTPELIRLIKDSINDLAGDDGWVFLGNLGVLIIKKQPDFDPRNYGYKKLTPLIRSMPEFEIQERKGKESDGIAVLVRLKEPAEPNAKRR
ncbi:NYN domain-containing protein [Flavitalea sp. BT771]|uniref:NYN domain-containing protein n=1 Tax=Flavitalea sp. BT771 TaxID=3063329 RepID=UPI0026E1BA78|nr:NYN domain-containing protein [Flavitalea sp. BT771]MDO6430378.1 NYN domain-containing protein [Flavitalea sp. BT771]MDV6219482.1 NYN domain-containing protein [Flavitalea sp. BT771]